MHSITILFDDLVTDTLRLQKYFLTGQQLIFIVTVVYALHYFFLDDLVRDTLSLETFYF